MAAKQIKFVYNNRDYTLEFNRRSARAVEQAGFNADEITTKPNVMIPILFAGAFQMHHRNTRQDITDEILAHMTNREELIKQLLIMYNETIESLLNDPEDGAEGNVTWSAQ